MAEDRLLNKTSGLQQFLYIEDFENDTGGETYKNDWKLCSTRLTRWASFRSGTLSLFARMDWTDQLPLWSQLWSIEAPNQTYYVRIFYLSNDGIHIKKKIKRPRLESSSGKALQMNGMTPLNFKMRHKIAQIWFSVVHGSPKKILLGSLYVDRCIENFLPMEQRIVSV